MSVELSDLFRAAAHQESIAAERDYPLGPDAVHRYVAAVVRRRVGRGVLIAAAGAVIIGAGALGVLRSWQGEQLAASPTPAITSSASATPSVTPSPTPSPGPTASESATSTAPSPSQTTPPAAVETTPPAPPEAPVGTLPGQVTTISAGHGGGSGEIVVDWNAVANATGYRVYRSLSADGPYVGAASIVAATGVTSVEFGGSYQLIQIWQSSPTTFQYVEVIDIAPVYFRVAAFNATGTGSKSTVVCGAPMGTDLAC